jgi:hypothetical protein
MGLLLRFVTVISFSSLSPQGHHSKRLLLKEFAIPTNTKSKIYIENNHSIGATS